MSRQIEVQTLVVSYSEDRSGWSTLVYTPYSLGAEGAIPEEAFQKHVNPWTTIGEKITRVRGAIDSLIQWAMRNEKRKGNELEATVQDLALEILPPEGLVNLVKRRHPQFDIVAGGASEIPWEVLEESHLYCPKGDRIVPVSEADHCCPRHGDPLQRGGGRLSLIYHLTHLVRGQGQAGGVGNEFLFVENPKVEDPREDLCSGINDPSGVCRSHLDELHQLVGDHGFVVNVLSKGDATKAHVLEAISNPALAGIYFFGHGYLPKRREESCLVLADKEYLRASEVINAHPAARFVFLNACWGAAIGATWDLEKRSFSIAEAFARGGNKVVIGPIFPVVNFQAAAAAVEFFKQAFSCEPLAQCLMTLRKASHARYEQGEADLSWLAYRYFGDPNKILSPMAAVDPNSRLFDAEGKLNVEVFGFGIDGVLQKAVQRRNSQRRLRITWRDLLAGLLGAGDLTRFLIRRLRIDPNILHDRLGGQIEQEEDTSPVVGASASRNETPSEGAEEGEAGAEKTPQWIVPRREEFRSEVLEVFARADREARKQEGDSIAISEREVLEGLCADNARLLSDAGIPSGFYSDLSRRAGELPVDDNGRVVLPECDPAAQKILEMVHMLAQHRGVCPITNRLMLAGLLVEKNGYAARVFRVAGVKPGRILLLLLAITEKNPPRAFGLSMEACERIVLPVLKEAQALTAQSGRHQIGERELFKAFCRRCAPPFKEAMKRPPLPFDLDAMESIEPPEATEEPPEVETEEDERPDSASTPPSDGSREIRSSDFDEPSWHVIENAYALSRAGGHQVIRSLYLLLALVTSDHGHPTFLSREILEVLRATVARCPRPPASAATNLGFSSNARRILRAARDLASSRGRSGISVEDLEAIVFADGGEEAARLLQEFARAVVPSLVVSAPSATVRRAGTLLRTIGRDLTEKAKCGELPEIIGRDSEIEIAVHILQQAESANPLLVGDAGVGKTAIAEGIALRLARGQCPKRLQSMRLVEISAQSLVADTGLRGQFEQRIQDLLVEARDNVILFLDEIHTLVGAGTANGASLDAGNMLKSALARGEIRLIGATTPSEYRRSIARDSALARRFRVQMIRPPSRDATLQILTSRQELLERHHGVTIAESARTAATDLSERYIVDKQWPAKARDLLDHACALAASENASGATTPEVTSAHVAKVVSQLTHIPLERLTVAEQSLLATLEDRLRRRIIGQDAAVSAVANAIRRGRQGLTPRGRPWGVFLFAGPPGVGKTELAKVLAEEVYGRQDGLIRFDMGDFTEPHSTARLLGSPPSYIGYGEGAPLVDRLRRQPYSLVLLDEIEHAHRDVLAVLLRLLSEGTIEDNDGNVGDARNCIIIMTTNAVDPSRNGPLGFAPRTQGAPAQGELRSQMEQVLSAKLIDRIDEIVCFRPLAQTDLEAIASLQVGQMLEPVATEQHLQVELAPDVIPWLAEKVSNQNAGARGMQRMLDAYIGSFLGTFLTRTACVAGTKVRILVKDGEIVASAPEG